MFWERPPAGGQGADCPQPTPCARGAGPTPDLNYLARDFESLRTAEQWERVPETFSRGQYDEYALAEILAECLAGSASTTRADAPETGRR